MVVKEQKGKLSILFLKDKHTHTHTDHKVNIFASMFEDSIQQYNPYIGATLLNVCKYGNKI